MYSLFYGAAIIGSVVSAELHVQTHHWANLEAERKKESPFSESVGNALILESSGLAAAGLGVLPLFSPGRKHYWNPFSFSFS